MRRLLPTHPKDIRDAEISDLDVAMSIQQQILGLQVTVDDVHAMEVFERKRDFCSVELRDRVREALGIISLA